MIHLAVVDPELGTQRGLLIIHFPGASVHRAKQRTRFLKLLLRMMR